MPKGRLCRAIHIGNIADHDGNGASTPAEEWGALLQKRAFNARDLPGMAIHDLYATPNREQPGFRIGSPSAPVIPVEWECRFTSRLTFYSAAGGEPLRQNALLRVIRLGTGEIYIPTDRATGAILFPPRPNATGDPEPALFQIELLRLRPARGGQPDDGERGHVRYRGLSAVR